MQNCIATCPKGGEQLLWNELSTLGATVESESVGSVKFTGDLTTVYRVCLWARVANKVLLPLVDKAVKADADLYDVVYDVPWEEHLEATGTLWIQFSGTSAYIRDSQFGARKAKDAIVDRMRDKCGERPSVAKHQPDLMINARLSKGRLMVAVDLCGESLHRRGYRSRQGAAPLKENLAAAILYRSGWQNMAQDKGNLLDPMCGSGTLLIEAAMIAADIAPGLAREQFALQRWLGHDEQIWSQLRAEAESRINYENIGEIRGYDISRVVINIAQENIAQAGLAGYVRVSLKPLAEFKKPTHKDIDPGLIITNPPYGERLGEVKELTILYRQMGDRFKEEFVGWQAGVFTGNPQAGKFMGLRASKKYKLFNGSIPAELLLFDIKPEQFVNAPAPDVILTAPNDPYKVTDGARMVMNRLKKNQKQLAKWRKNNNVDCYRLYDADMPEYSAAVDVYGEYVHVQEYQAPKSVAEHKAQARFNDMVAAVKQVVQPDIDKISLKQRRRNKGTSQYQALAEKTGRVFEVQELGAKFEINLWDYLDSGLFLDHRPVRAYIHQHAGGKKFLNLFCYTASASVHAALGGATETVNVDMSHTYLDWAQRNFKLNNLRSHKHRFERADCLEWLKRCREGFDLILLDPPTFSNSKKMDSTLDIQRDHVMLIRRCMDLLTDQGQLVFSNNLRTFELDRDALSAFEIKDYHKESLDPDFQRNVKIHQCWLIEHKG